MRSVVYAIAIGTAVAAGLVVLMRWLRRQAGPAIVESRRRLTRRGHRSMRIHKRRRDIERDLPDALLFLSVGLRAGSALQTAMVVFVREHDGALADEFDQILAEQRLGVPFDDALRQAAARIALSDFTLFTVALRVSREVGGNLADALSLLSQTSRRKLVMEGRIRALTSQGRAQGIVMTLLPIVLGLVLYVVQPGMELLLTTPVGWVVTGAASSLLLLGHLMIRRIVAIDV